MSREAKMPRHRVLKRSSGDVWLAASIATPSGRRASNSFSHAARYDNAAIRADAVRSERAYREAAVSPDRRNAGETIVRFDAAAREMRPRARLRRLT